MNQVVAPLHKEIAAIEQFRGYQVERAGFTLSVKFAYGIIYMDLHDYI